MAMNFGGDFVVRQKREEVFDFLTDANRFCPLLPGYQGMTPEDESHFSVKLDVGVSYIRGTANVKLHLAQAERPDYAKYQGMGTMAGGTVNLMAGFDLEDSPEGTRVSWKGEAQIFGPLASLAGGMLEPLARKNVQKLIDGLQAALETPAQKGSGA